MRAASRRLRGAAALIAVLLAAFAPRSSFGDPARAEKTANPTKDAPVALPSDGATSNASREETPADLTQVVQEGNVSGKAPTCWPALPWAEHQRSLALLATLGSYSGFGLGVRAGSARFGFDGSFGFLPVFATFQQTTESDPDFKLLSASAFSAGAYIGIHRTDPRTDLGISFGYKYSTLLGHGGSVAFYVKRELAAHWTLQFFIGPAFFPDAEDRIRRETGWKNGSVGSGIAVHQGGGGISLAFFP